MFDALEVIVYTRVVHTWPRIGRVASFVCGRSHWSVTESTSQPRRCVRRVDARFSIPVIFNGRRNFVISLRINRERIALVLLNRIGGYQ